MKQVLPAFLLTLFSVQHLSAQNNFVAGIDLNAATAFQPSGSRTICDTVFSFQTIDTWPGGITTDGDFIFNNGNNSDFIYKYSFTGAVIDSFVNPAAASTAYPNGDMDFDGTNLLVLAEELDTIYRLNPNTGAVVSQFKVAPCAGSCFGVAYDGAFIWVSNYGPAYLYKLDALTGALLSSFPLVTPSTLLPIKIINGALYGLGLNPPTIFELDTTTGNIISSQPWCLGYPLGFCMANNQLWGVSSWITVGGSQRIYQFDTSFVTQTPVYFSSVDAFEVFPNPAPGNITITLNRSINNASLEIFSTLGERIYRENISVYQKQINLKNISPGIYFVKLNERGKTHIKKLMIKEPY